MKKSILKKALLPSHQCARVITLPDFVIKINN